MKPTYSSPIPLAASVIIQRSDSVVEIEIFAVELEGLVVSPAIPDQRRQ
jgi:hypothetical protein